MSIIDRYRRFKNGAAAEFRELIGPLLASSLVQRLDDYQQHDTYTRLQHSVDVAYASFCVTKLLGWNSAEAARAGLLHDLFFQPEEGKSAASLILSHPQIALVNARSVCALTPREENTILRHMWLLTITPPRYREGYVVTFVDKFCAAREFIVSFCTRKKRRAYFAA